MSVKFFLDTNIFVYSFDPRDKIKQKISMELINQALDTQNGMISYQVIQEFLNVSTRKFSKPLSVDDAKYYLQKVLDPLCQIYPNIDIYSEALLLSKRTGYSFYDSLILVSALAGNCKEIYTEDLQDNQQITGLTILNPFKGSSTKKNRITSELVF
jgi:predicted nucleic acid-binding protein